MTAGDSSVSIEDVLRRLIRDELSALLTSTARQGTAPEQQQLLLTISETAELLRVNKATIYRLFDRGELRWVKVGGRRLVRRTEIDRFIADHERGA
ncbi:helix-turn-helix domain-containing protein [Mycolicibacterium fortuitum]|uniref:helix-turn-helix domain-containing protein n=1 Tax=Mycolicibacterium fortuitum TaxID=1766 RepID=UPI00149009DC|nr:helix-turn-helix domain-containing protein [Mycolicibacterium fortuitum]